MKEPIDSLKQIIPLRKQCSGILRDKIQYDEHESQCNS